MVATVTVEKIREPALVFASNVRRVKSLAALPGMLVGRTEDRMRESYSQWLNIEVIQKTETPRPDLEFAPGHLADLAMRFPEEVAVGLQALMAAILIGAWTAFETLAGDLWVAAVNARPESLALNVFPADAMIKVSVLRELDGPLAEHYGDVFRKKDPKSFNSLAGIRDAYSQAFRVPPGKPNARTSPNLEDLFTSSHSQLRTLELLRNLLAHQGGKIDGVFLNSIKTLDAELAKLTDHDELFIDGNRLFNHVTAAVDASIKLVRFVDVWMGQIKN